MWRIKPFPELTNHKNVVIDTETSGLDIWGSSVPVGLAVATEEDTYYFPWGHDSGEQVPLDKVRWWAKNELQGKVIIGHNLKYDLHMLEKVSTNLREVENSFADTMNMQALLNERPPGGFSLSAMSKNHLNEDKIGQDLDMSKIKEYPSHIIGPYAERDAELTLGLYNKLMFDLELDKLLDAHRLECRVIPAVVDMEHHGLPLNILKLRAWQQKASKEYHQLLTELDLITTGMSQESFLEEPSVHTFNPDSGIHLKRYFDKNNLPYPFNLACIDCKTTFVGGVGTNCEKCGSKNVTAKNPHFGAQFLKNMKNPQVDRILRVRKLGKVISSALVPWGKYHDKGVLRFNLNQLRSDEYGTISGRFSSNNYDPNRDRKAGYHPQQISNEEKQLEEIGPDYILRELLVPGQHALGYFSADASQIEYRLFAHYSGFYTTDSMLVRAYVSNPLMDFHQYICDQVFKGIVTRKQTKNLNFGMIYGLGKEKLARTLGVSIEEVWGIFNEYARVIPEAKALIQASKDAGKARGWVKSANGRTMKVNPDKSYVGLNRVIQGSAAEIMKDRMAMVYENKAAIGILPRCTIHDELIGDLLEDKAGERLKEALEDFSLFPVKVPLLWSVREGNNWAMR